MCNVVHCSFIGHYMFRSNWPSSGVQVVVVMDSAAHCNAVGFPPTLVASRYFGYVGCKYNRRKESRITESSRNHNHNNLYT
jgi:hypothetical protein